MDAARKGRPGHPHRETLITDNGVTSVRKRPYPGGWAEFRYDDRADRAEQRGRAGGAP